MSRNFAWTLRIFFGQRRRQHCGAELLRRVVVFSYICARVIPTHLNRSDSPCLPKNWPNPTHDQHSDCRNSGLYPLPPTTINRAINESERMRFGWLNIWYELYPEEFLSVVFDCCFKNCNKLCFFYYSFIVKQYKFTDSKWNENTNGWAAHGITLSNFEIME